MAWRWAFGVLVLAGALPIMLARHPPLQDYPRHLLVAQILARYDDPGQDYCLHFERDVRLRPYLGMYGLALLLSPPLSCEAVGRLSLLAYVLLTPMAVAGYTREVAPGSVAAALGALPALWSSLYYLGFVNFLMALPWVFAGAWAFLRIGRGRWRAAAAAFLGAATLAYLCHALAFAVLLLACGLFVPMAPRGRRAIGASVLALVALAAAASVGEAPGASGVEYVPFGGAIPPQGAGRGYVYLSPWVTLLHVAGFVATDAELVGAALWGLPLGALALAAWKARGVARARRRPERLVLPALAAVLLFALPHGTPDIDFVNVKMLAFLALSWPGLVPPGWLDGRTVATLGVFAAASIAVAGATHARVDAEHAGLDEVVARIPRGATVLPIVVDPGSRALLWAAPFVHVGDHVQVARGGRGVEAFEGPQMPVRMRAEGLTGFSRYLGKPWLVTASLPGAAPDLVLLKGSGPLREHVAQGSELVLQRGAFALYRPREAP